MCKVNEFDNPWHDWNELAVLESAVATPNSVEENIQRGRMAMQHVIASHKMETHAMYRKDIGWIGFEWGKPGDCPPVFENDEDALKWWNGLKNKHLTFLHGRGISHIIAKRDWEGKWIKEFIGQKGIEVAYTLIEVIAKGKIKPANNKKFIHYRDYVAILSRPEKWEKNLKHDEEWLLSGFEIEKEGYQFILESAGEYGGTAAPFDAQRQTISTCPSCFGTPRQAVAASSRNKRLESADDMVVSSSSIKSQAEALYRDTISTNPPPLDPVGEWVPQIQFSILNSYCNEVNPGWLYDL